MNYLAHLFLAGDGDDARLGSVLGDFVKGDPAGRLTRGERFKGAIREVEEHNGHLEADFLRFFPDLVGFVYGADQQSRPEK